MNAYFNAPKEKTVTTEEKAEFIKRNREFLITPVNTIITEDVIDKMVYDIKNNWKDGGYITHEMLDDMYYNLKNAGYK